MADNHETLSTHGDFDECLEESDLPADPLDHWSPLLIYGAVLVNNYCQHEFLAVASIYPRFQPVEPMMLTRFFFEILKCKSVSYACALRHCCVLRARPPCKVPGCSLLLDGSEHAYGMRVYHDYSDIGTHNLSMLLCIEANVQPLSRVLLLIS